MLYQLHSALDKCLNFFLTESKKEIARVDWSSLSNAHIATFQEPLEIVAEVIERTRIAMTTNNYDLRVFARFDTKNEGVQIIQTNDDDAFETLLASISVASSNELPAEIIVVNYNLNQSETGFFSGIRSSIRPYEKLPLKTVVPEDLMY